MIFGVILAGGSGVRMTNNNLPKQFIKLCNKPIIIHAIERMLTVGKFEKICVAINPNYAQLFDEMLNEYKVDLDKILVIDGGKERIDSVENSIKAICELSKNDNDIVIIHDGVRPCVSQKVLLDGIKTASEFGACVAVVPVVDTTYILNEDAEIASAPERKYVYSGQAPDCFNLKLLKNALESLSKEEKTKITGTVQICQMRGIPVKTFEGDYNNIKITTEKDLVIAQNILEKGY